MQVVGSKDAAPAPVRGGVVTDDDLGDDNPSAVELEPVALPEIRTSFRAKRRLERQRAQRRRYLALSTAAIVVASAAAFLVLREDGGRTPSPEDAATGDTVAGGPAPLLLAQVGADGWAVSITVLVPGPDGEGGTVLLVPVGTMTEIAGLGPQPVGRALQLGGEERLRTTTQNLLGADLDDAIAVDDDELGALLRPAGSLRVSLADRVEQVDDDGLVTVLFEEGTFDLQPSDVGDFLGAKGSGSDLSRLARHQVFWDAWLAVLRSDPASLPDGPRALRNALSALSAGDTRVRLLPVASFGSAPDQGELYTATAADVAALVDDVFRGRSAATGPRTRVRVLNGTGELELAQRVTERLAPADVQVTLTGNAEPFGYETTQIIYYDPAKRAMAERIRETLGVGMLVRNRNETGVVDVTIIVGKDFRAE